MSLIFVGIDPGKSGGIACIETPEDPIRTNNVSYSVMPETEKDIWYALHKLTTMVRLPSRDIYVVLERVHAMPKQGVSSSFTFGAGYGGLRMALTGLGIRFDDIPPQQWMRGLGIPSAKGIKDKMRLVARAQQLFPELPLWNLPRSKGLQKSIADALLIAEFCRRRFTIPF